MDEEFRSLFDRARTGDVAASGALLERHLFALRAYLRLKTGRLIRARESASDLVQSVCREALADLSRVECADEAAFRGWLYAIATHKVLNRAGFYTAEKRDAAREVTLGGGAAGGETSDEQGLLEAYGSICTPSRDAVVREEIARIEAAFDRLPDEHREVILLARFEDLSHRQIAERLGKSEEAIRKSLSRARARLALLLDGGESS